MPSVLITGSNKPEEIIDLQLVTFLERRDIFDAVLFLGILCLIPRKILIGNFE